MRALLLATSYAIGASYSRYLLLARAQASYACSTRQCKSQRQASKSQLTCTIAVPARGVSGESSRRRHAVDCKQQTRIAEALRTWLQPARRTLVAATSPHATPALENRRGNTYQLSLQRAVETSRARRRPLVVKHCTSSTCTRQAGRRRQDRTAALCISRRGGAAKTPKFEDKWEKFCGVPDCYTELGLFPNATEGADPTSLPSLSLEFHPDKNPGDQRALRKFNRVARANEVLTDDEQRKKLDYYTENPSEYWSLYGTFVDFSYAPKTSLKGVLFILLVFAALVQPALQYSKYQEYTKALVKAALARAPEGAAFRKEADEIVAEESKKRKEGQKDKDDVPRGKSVSQGNSPEISREERVARRVRVSVAQGQFIRQGRSLSPLDVQVQC